MPYEPTGTIQMQLYNSCMGGGGGRHMTQFAREMGSLTNQVKDQGLHDAFQENRSDYTVATDSDRQKAKQTRRW